MHEIEIKGMLSNFGYLMLLIIINEIMIPKINATYGLYNPLR